MVKDVPVDTPLGTIDVDDNTEDMEVDISPSPGPDALGPSPCPGALGPSPGLCSDSRRAARMKRLNGAEARGRGAEEGAESCIGVAWREESVMVRLEGMTYEVISKRAGREIGDGEMIGYVEKVVANAGWRR